MIPGSGPLFVEMLRAPFLRYALVAGLLAGSVCAFLGTYVILRRIVFLGVALSQAAALGVALGLFVGWNPEATASGLTLLTALLFSLSGRHRVLSQESVIGWAYVVAAGVAIILIAKNPIAEAHGLDVVSGSLLFATGDLAWKTVPLAFESHLGKCLICHGLLLLRLHLDSGEGKHYVFPNREVGDQMETLEHKTQKVQ